MDSVNRMLPKTFLLCLASAMMLCAASGQAAAAIIASGQISGFDRAGPDEFYGATGSTVRDLSFSHHEAFITTDGIRLSLTSTSSTFFNVTGAVVDTYTINGGTPGEMLAFSAFLNIDGSSQNLFTPVLNAFHGHSNINYGVGLAINSHPENAGIAAVPNPVIDTGNGLVSGQFGVVFGPNGEFSVASTPNQLQVAIDAAIEIPLVVTVGDPFVLAVSVGIDHTNLAHTDMLSTATLSFDLPEGYQVQSDLGFVETTAVPLPPALLLAMTGLAGMLGLGRRRAV